MAKSILKVLLCVVLVVSLCPPFYGAFADEADAQDQGQSAAVEVQADEADADDEAAAADEAAEDSADEKAAEPAATEGDEAAEKSQAAEADKAMAADNKAKEAAKADEDAGKASSASSAEDPEAKADEPAAEQAEPSSNSSAQLDGATMLKAKAKGIYATLLVDASANLPADAKLVITPLVKHEAEAEGVADDGDADEAAAEDEEADELEGSEGEEGIDPEEEASDAQEAEADAEEAAADDELTDEAADEADDEAADPDEDATDEPAADKPTADPEPTTITGSQAALSGITKAVQAFRAKKGAAAAAAVVDAYAIEVVDEQGDLVPVDDEDAKLTVTLEDGDEDAADYEKVYAVDRDAKEQQSVADAAETEYADEDAAAKEIPYKAEATDVTESAKTDEQAEETTIELDGVRSIATTTEQPEPKAEDAKAETASTAAATPKAKVKAPRKAIAHGQKGNDVADVAGKKESNVVDNTQYGLTINMFDYSIREPFGTYDGSGDGQYNMYIPGNDDTGINKNHEFKFVSGGVKPTGGNWTINSYTSLTQDNKPYPLQGVVHNNLTGGYPVLSTGKNTSLDYLFNDDATVIGKQIYNNMTGLLISGVEDSGTYTESAAGPFLRYDSNKNYAYFDTSNYSANGKNEFYLYDGTYHKQDVNESTSTVTGNTYNIGFFPFDKWTNSSSDLQTPGNKNHHFGLTMSGKFTIPNNQAKQVMVREEESQRLKGYDMVFDFSGDDDIWVFIDDVLVLDLGGVHQPVHGNINLTKDTVVIDGDPYFGRDDEHLGAGYVKSCAVKTVDDQTKILGLNTSISKAFELAGKQWNNAAGSEHEIKVFYLERGSYDSNLALTMALNFKKLTTLTAKKEWTDGAAAHQDDTVFVQLYRQTQVLNDLGQPLDADGNVAATSGKPIAYTTKEAVGDPEPLNKDNNWSHDFEKLPVVGDMADDYYYYTVEEGTATWDASQQKYVNFQASNSLNCANGYSYDLQTISYEKTGSNTETWPTKDDAAFHNGNTAVSVGTATLTNKPKTTSVDVEKRWRGGSEPASGSIWVKLLNSEDSSFSKVLELNKSKQWKGTFSDLPVKGEYKVMEGSSASGPFNNADFTISGAECKHISTEYFTDANASADKKVAGDGGLTAVVDYSGKAIITNGPISTDLVIKKTDATAPSTTLQGAEFELYKGSEFDSAERVPNATTVFKTGADGTVRIEGLTPDTYWVKETKAPTGYVVREADNPIKVVVSAAGVPTIDGLSGAETAMRPSIPTTAETDGSYTLTVPNMRAYALPAASGPGILELLFLGAFAMTLAIGLRRRNPGLQAAGNAVRAATTGRRRK